MIVCGHVKAVTAYQRSRLFPRNPVIVKTVWPFGIYVIEVAEPQRLGGFEERAGALGRDARAGFRHAQEAGLLVGVVGLFGAFGGELGVTAVGKELEKRDARFKGE